MLRKNRVVAVLVVEMVLAVGGSLALGLTGHPILATICTVCVCLEVLALWGLRKLVPMV